MNPQIAALFDEAENRYLKSEELAQISQYVDSLPDRLDAYRALRDRELEIMQQVADQLQMAMPQEPIENLERRIKNALLSLRYCAIGMLLNDESFIQKRLLRWLGSTVSVLNTMAIDAKLHQLLNQQLEQTLEPTHMSLLNPQLKLAQTVLLQQTPES
jgi:hypothetical protein